MGTPATRVERQTAASGDRKATRRAAVPATVGPRRMTHLAYERLCEAIVTLDLRPGALVNEKQLGTRLGIAQPTLVQALHRAALFRRWSPIGAG